eukprot:symbB.v1.2.024957.t1/scaffold2364.1/size162346/4
MSLVAGATLLNGIGHLANLGQFVEIGQGQAFQREQMQWARRAYYFILRCGPKTSTKDWKTKDTLLVVHTLLLTFALATLQYSDQFVPVSGCVECEENEHPWLVTCWVYAVSGILILPFWGIVLQLGFCFGDAESSIHGANLMSNSLSADINTESCGADREGSQLLERVEGAVTRLSSFVVEHQESFKRVWNQECRFMISAATVFLWVSCVLAILITAGMFWLFLQNHMAGQHRHAATHFALCTLGTVCGLMMPLFYGLWFRLTCRDDSKLRRTEHETGPTFEDCIEPPENLAGASAPALITSVSSSVSSASSHAAALLGALGRRGLALRRGGVREGGNLDEGVLMAERPSGLPILEDDFDTRFNEMT